MLSDSHIFEKLRIPILGILIALAVGMAASLTDLIDATEKKMLKAVWRGETDTVREILNKGANPDYRHKGRTALMFIARNGKPEIAKILLDKAADPNARALDNGATPLTIAAEHGNLEVAKILLDRGADINASNNNGNTPLMYASEFCHLKLAKIMLERGADINLRDKDNETAFMMASRRGHTQIMKILKQAGAKEELPGTIGSPDNRKSLC